jgi:hypothetical protein
MCLQPTFAYMRRIEGSVRCDICVTYTLQTVAQGAISHPSPLEQMEVERCRYSKVWPWFLCRLITFEKATRGETNFQQTCPPLFVEVDMQPMPSSLLGHRHGQSIGCRNGVALTILSGNLSCFIPFLRGISPLWDWMYV